MQRCLLKNVGFAILGIRSCTMQRCLPKSVELPEQEQEVAGPTSFTSDFVPMSLSQPEMLVLKSAPLREQFQ